MTELHKLHDHEQQNAPFWSYYDLLVTPPGNQEIGKEHMIYIEGTLDFSRY